MTRLSKRLPDDYAALLAEVKKRVRSAQYEALKAVNKELVALYWDIGKLIVSRQTDADHGAAIVEQLAEDLRQAFPGIRGYSRRNLFYMREFSVHHEPVYNDAPIQGGMATCGISIVPHRCSRKRCMSRFIRPKVNQS